MVNKLNLKVVVANRGRLLVPTGFSGYDLCLNTYVGCQFGCAYCYVRWFQKDEDKDWGQFVRVREHVCDKMPKELAVTHFSLPTKEKRPKLKGGQPVLRDGKQIQETVYRPLAREQARLVIGTMTDPYQPLERKHRITRSALDAILRSCDSHGPLNKVGIFSRSPIIVEDLDRIVKLPRGRVHFTITPYPPEVLQRIEPIAIQTARRFDTVRQLKAAGVRVHCNIAPAMPMLSESFTTSFAEQLADIGVDEFFVDPVQPYKEALEALDVTMADHADWPRVRKILTDGDSFAAWKEEYRAVWTQAWRSVQGRSPHTLPIWSDHVHHTWVDLRTDQPMSKRLYGDDMS